MSYILDALQKSTAEGNPAVVTSLLRSDTRHHKLRPTGSLIILALIVNVIVFAWLFWPERSNLRQMTQPAAPTPETLDNPAVKASRQTKPPPEPSISTAVSQTPTQIRVDTTPVALQTVTLGDLPTTARLAFPDIEFSTHVYAEDPTLRAVVANGRRLTEGDSIEGLKLIEITQAGVIFRYQEYLITVSVLALWEE